MKDIIRHILKEDQQKLYLDKVVDTLVNDTEFDEFHELIYLPAVDPTDVSTQRVKFFTFTQSLYRRTYPPNPINLNYLNVVYGLTLEESIEVWDKYKEIIYKMVTSRFRY